MPACHTVDVAAQTERKASHVETIGTGEPLQLIELDNIPQDAENIVVVKAIVARLDGSMRGEDALLAHLFYLGGSWIGQAAMPEQQ